jgi:hypothetical protein
MHLSKCEPAEVAVRLRNTEGQPSARLSHRRNSAIEAGALAGDIRRSSFRGPISRGLGSVQAQQLARRFANAAQTMSGPWFKALGAARDIHETREVARAIAEWSDGAIASRRITPTVTTSSARATRRVQAIRRF